MQLPLTRFACLFVVLLFALALVDAVVTLRTDDVWPALVVAGGGVVCAFIADLLLEGRR